MIRFARATAFLVGITLLLAACDGGDPADPAPSPTASTSDAPAALKATTSASDGGVAEVGESTFTVVDPAHNGGVDVAWAGEIANRSATDLLVYINLQLTFTGGDGKKHVEPWEGFFDVLPGSTTVKGRVMTLDFAPEALDVAVADEQWYPVADLAAQGMSVGASVSTSKVEVTDDEVTVEAAVDAAYTGVVSGSYRLLLVFRDAKGKLVGAAEAADVSALGAGSTTVEGSIPRRWWPEDADPGESGAALVKTCCSWMGGP